MANPSLIPSVLTADLGSGFAKVFLVGALISVFSTAIATLATIVRMIYGMGRNGQLPGSKFLTRLSPRTDEPVGSIAVAVVLSLIPLIFIKRIEVIVAAITALIIVAYILVLGSLLVRRFQGWPRNESRFNLRRWGIPVTVAGLAWTVFVLIDAAWPREATNPDLGPLPIIEDLGIGIIVVGTVWWFVSARAKSRPENEPAGAVPIEAE
jgi:amino acid transporter